MYVSIGQEFFVGLSKRTNRRGAEILADTFKVGFGAFDRRLYSNVKVQKRSKLDGASSTVPHNSVSSVSSVCLAGKFSGLFSGWKPVRSE